LQDCIKLARREREILRLSVIGQNPKQIAAEMELSVGTVNDRLRGAASKVGVNGRQELMVWVLQHPDALDQGVVAPRGLHPSGCRCASPYCMAMFLRTRHPSCCQCQGAGCLPSDRQLIAA
jgi:DNA-binding CsgD family transcriptional regulator